MSKQTTAPSEPVRDARKLGVGKMLILGIQHISPCLALPF